MRGILLTMSLFAALSGPLMRAAEGADDLARSLAELGCPPLLEETDGGVGDDSGTAVLTANSGVLDGTITYHICTWSLYGATGWTDQGSQLGWVASLSARRVSRSGALGSPLRFAWLQRFLF
jgi:hypothetical protein